MKARDLEGLQNLSEVLGRQLARAGLSVEEVNRRLGWPSDALRLRLETDGGLRIDQLREVLDAAGLSEKAFFAELYDLEPKRSGKGGEEIPYSTGSLSDQDTADFPPSGEVLGLFRLLVQEGLRNARDVSTGSVSGDDFPEDRPPKRGGPPRRRSS
jgi:hypothetical protein